jgi:hypothetical protein
MTTLSFSTIFSPAGIAAPQQAVMIGKNGDITARRGETDTLFSLRSSLFEPGWALRSATMDAATNTLRIQAATAGSQITVKPTVLAEGKTLRVSVAFTADKDTPVNSTHVSVNLPVGAYAGTEAVWKGTTTGAARTVAVPAAAKETRLIDGTDGSLTLSGKNGAGKMTVAATGATGVMLQDNRVFGGSELEIRVGGITEHTMKAGQTETVSFTITLPETIALENEKPTGYAASADWIPTRAEVARHRARLRARLFGVPVRRSGGEIRSPDRPIRRPLRL